MLQQWVLCQTLNAEFASKGIQHIVVDGMVDAPDTLGKMLGKNYFNNLEKQKAWSMMD